MLSKQMLESIQSNSLIRAMFEEGNRLAEKYGQENIYDFSLGNPVTSPPAAVKKALLNILEEENTMALHGYMNNSGFPAVRQTIAQHLNTKHTLNLTAENIIMSSGAAGALNVLLKILLNPGDEVIVFKPYFSEYQNYIKNYQGLMVPVNCNEDFSPNLADLKQKINLNTKAILINSPNNPSGVVYSEQFIKDLGKILDGTGIYLISDEPYREIIYDDVQVPFLPNYYPNTLICYSYSKSLSLPGERIGYITIPNEVVENTLLIQMANIATRTLGFCNANALFQKVVAKCINCRPNIALYQDNRAVLLKELRDLGYEIPQPQGAFYMLIKALEADEIAFCERAKEHHILLVPSSSFGIKGYARLAYCVSKKTVKNALPAFKKLKASYI